MLIRRHNLTHVCTLGGIGFLGPALGVGAAGGAVAVLGQMMSSCPRNRPCRVGFHKFELKFAIFCQWKRDPEMYNVYFLFTEKGPKKPSSSEMLPAGQDFQWKTEMSKTMSYWITNIINVF